jgi:hypothetical protein
MLACTHLGSKNRTPPLRANLWGRRKGVKPLFYSGVLYPISHSLTTPRGAPPLFPRWEPSVGRGARSAPWLRYWAVRHTPQLLTNFVPYANPNISESGLTGVGSWHMIRTVVLTRGDKVCRPMWMHRPGCVLFFFAAQRPLSWLNAESAHQRRRRTRVCIQVLFIRVNAALVRNLGNPLTIS